VNDKYYIITTRLIEKIFVYVVCRVIIFKCNWHVIWKITIRFWLQTLRINDRHVYCLSSAEKRDDHHHCCLTQSFRLQCYIWKSYLTGEPLVCACVLIEHVSHVARHTIIDKSTNEGKFVVTVFSWHTNENEPVMFYETLERKWWRVIYWFIDVTWSNLLATNIDRRVFSHVKAIDFASIDGHRLLFLFFFFFHQGEDTFD
jgi:hypothetical protein